MKDPRRRQAARDVALERLAWEQREADKLVALGFDVYVASWVCDRIAVKDGKVYLVEFKQPGQTLRPMQQSVRDADPERYIVTYSPMREERR